VNSLTSGTCPQKGIKDSVEFLALGHKDAPEITCLLPPRRFASCVAFSPGLLAVRIYPRNTEVKCAHDDAFAHEAPGTREE
jgi:hypothetical protein